MGANVSKLAKMEEGTVAKQSGPISFSLSGCGFLGVYHIGVISCLLQHVPELLENARFCGASAGALIACSVICKVPMNDCVDFTLRLARRSLSEAMWGWEPSVNIEKDLRNAIDMVLPENAHELCTGRLFVSVTSLTDWKNMIISKFRSRNHLIHVLLCSCYVPGFSNYTIPTLDGHYVIDGGLSDNLPVLDDNTVTICPWAGEHSICPRDDQGHSYPFTVLNMTLCPSSKNAGRLKDAFFCPPEEELKNYAWAGHDDAMRFLLENDLVHCPVHRVLTVLTNLEERIDCEECQHHVHHVRNSCLPPTIIACWEVSKLAFKEASGMASSMAMVSVRRVFSFWTIPVTLFRHFVLQLFMLAYAEMDKVRKGALSAEVVARIKRLLSPRRLFWELFLFSATKSIMAAFEFIANMGCKMATSVKSVVYTYQKATQEICISCGQPLSNPAGARNANRRPSAFLAVSDDDDEQIAGEEAGLQAEAAERREEEDLVPEIVVQDLSHRQVIAGLPRRAVEGVGEEGAEVGGSPPDSPTADMVGIQVDIHADPMDMTLDLVLPAEADNQDQAPAPQQQQPQKTVHVESVGQIKDVQMSVMDSSSSKPQQQKLHRFDERMPEKVPKLRKPKPERVHKFLHRYEHYKGVMTLHYVDECHHRRTETLFVEEEEEEEEEDDQPAGATCSALTEEREKRREGRKKVGENAVNKEIKQLLETKLFTGQRQFEKDYETRHQLKLKKRGKTETKKDTGHFSLQLIEMNTDHIIPGSPALSRASSLRSVANEDHELVRSLSDACDLAKSLRLLHEKRKARKRSSDESSDRPTVPQQSAKKEESSLLSPALPPLPAFASTQEQTPVHPLRKCHSDTSDVAANLRRLKAGMVELKECRIAEEEGRNILAGGEEKGEEVDSSKAAATAQNCPLHRTATAPVLSSSSSSSSTAREVKVEASKQGKVKVLERGQKVKALEQGEAKVLEQGQRVKVLEQGQKIKTSEQGEAKVSGQGQKVKAEGSSSSSSEGRLKRGGSIRGSGERQTQLLSNLKQMKEAGTTDISSERASSSSSSSGSSQSPSS